MKLLKIILPFLLFTLISNTTFATVSHEGKELKEITHFARKLGYKTKKQLYKFTEFTKYISRDQTGAIGNLSKRIDDAGDIASNPAVREKLFKELASEAQMVEKGVVVAGKGARKEFRNAKFAAQKYGGHADDYVKKSSCSVLSPDNRNISTHWIENIKTGERFEFKTIYKDMTK